MQIPFSPLFLALLLLLGYLLAIWWILRKESKATLFYLTILSVVALALRLIFIYEIPPGLNDDEVKTLGEAFLRYSNREIFVLGVEGPILHAVLFQVPVAMLTDSLFWGMRAYPIAFSTLAIPVCFAIGRAMRFGLLGSYVLSALVTVLSWSLFWSRMPWGGEIIFYQALLLTAAARIVWQSGGLPEVAIGILGLSGCLWEYTGAWSMASVPFLALLVSPNRRARINSLLIFIGALILWLPYIFNFISWWPYVTEKFVFSSGAKSGPAFLASLRTLVIGVLETFVVPAGSVNWISIDHGALHPIAVLIAAALGLAVAELRKKIFLLGGFAAGLSTSIVSAGTFVPSTHRMICSFLFVSIAAAAFFDRLWVGVSAHRLRRYLIAPMVGLFVFGVSWQSLSLFFSDSFLAKSRSIFQHGETLLSEALPLPARDRERPTLIDSGIIRFINARSPNQRDYRLIDYENFFPREVKSYAFSGRFGALLGFYRAALVDPGAVKVFGGGDDRPLSFMVSFEEDDLIRWSRFGWRLRFSCVDAKESLELRVPLLVLDQTFLNSRMGCRGPRRYLFSAKYLGPKGELTLLATPDLNVSVNTSKSGVIERSAGGQAKLSFSIEQGDDLEVSLTAPNDGPYALLGARGGAKEQVLPPRLETFEPK